MGARGPKPKHPDLRVFEGNPARRPIPVVPDPGGGVPSAPSWLGRAARAEWKRVVGYLSGIGLRDVDQSALGNYCLWFARKARLAKYLEKHGDVDENGKARPEVAMLRDASSHERQWMGELGLTPAARVKLGGLEKSGSSAMDEFLGELKKVRGQS